MPINWSAPLLSGMKGWWWAETGLPPQDKTTNGNHGVFEGTGTPSIAAIGSTGLNAWAFVNANSQRWRATGTSHLFGGSAYTVSAWVRRDGQMGGVGAAWMGNYNNTGPKGYGLSLLQTTSISFAGRASACNGSAYYHAAAVDSVNTLATWYHFTATFAAGTLALYLNGNTTPIATLGSVPDIAVANAGNPFVCGTDSLNTRQWNGAIGDVAVWNRGLSPSEVAAWYTSSSGGHAVLMTSVPAVRVSMVGSRLIGSPFIR